MIGLHQYMIVRCPRCEIVIERVTPETMVYCLTCRKWCREVGEVKSAPATAPPPLPKPRRRFRCH